MSYFIFSNNSENLEGSLYRIAENQFDLNNLNIIQTEYKIIEDSIENFNDVKYCKKYVVKYNLNTIIYAETVNNWHKISLQNYINNIKKPIKDFIDNNPNHLFLNPWNIYYNQLNNFNLDSITYPLTKSLEQYFKDLGQPSYNILQLP